jgi:dihydropteroate synthase
MKDQRTGVHIRPVARLSGHTRAGEPAAIAVGGLPACRFAAAEVVVRRGSDVQRHVAGAGDLIAGADAEVRRRLQLIQEPRAPIAGVALDRPRIMGIVNVTPDSFSDGGLFATPDAAVAHALLLEAEGADILDIGGESTRPRSHAVDLEEECNRVLPVIATLAKRSRIPISVDTRKAEVMRRAALEGASVVNDVSALTHDPASLATVASLGLPVVLMHAQGDPRTMQDNPIYDDVVLDVCDMLEGRIAACLEAGIPRSRLIVDPGIGFGKTVTHNLALLGALSLYHGMGCAVMVGASRKSFIGRLSGAEAPDRIPGSVAAALVAVSQGAQLLRVHDVAATRQALAVWEGAWE